MLRNPSANFACNNFSTSPYADWIFNSVLARLGILASWNGSRRLVWIFGVKHGESSLLSVGGIGREACTQLLLEAVGHPSSHLLWLTWNVLVMSTAEKMKQKNTLLSLLVICEVNYVNKIHNSLCVRTPKVKIVFEACIYNWQWWERFLQEAGSAGPRFW